MNITVVDFWIRIFDKPEVLIYFDRKKNKPDKITDSHDMSDFISKNGERRLVDFGVSMEDSMVWIEI